MGYSDWSYPSKMQLQIRPIDRPYIKLCANCLSFTKALKYNEFRHSGILWRC